LLNFDLILNHKTLNFFLKIIPRTAKNIKTPKTHIQTFPVPPDFGAQQAWLLELQLWARLCSLLKQELLHAPPANSQALVVCGVVQEPARQQICPDCVSEADVVEPPWQICPDGQIIPCWKTDFPP